MLLWRSRDAGVAISSSHALAQSDAMYAQTVIQGAKTILTPPATRDDHQIPCNHCGQTIFGTRYQCAHCPSYPTAYNLVNTIDVPVMSVWTDFPASARIARRDHGQSMTPCTSSSSSLDLCNALLNQELPSCLLCASTLSHSHLPVLTYSRRYAVPAGPQPGSTRVYDPKRAPASV